MWIKHFRCIWHLHVQHELTWISLLSLGSVHPVEPVGAGDPRNPRSSTGLWDDRADVDQEKKHCSTAAQPAGRLKNTWHSALWGPAVWPKMEGFPFANSIILSVFIIIRSLISKTHKNNQLTVTRVPWGDWRLISDNISISNLHVRANYRPNR